MRPPNPGIRTRSRRGSGLLGHAAHDFDSIRGRALDQCSLAAFPWPAAPMRHHERGRAAERQLAAMHTPLRRWAGSRNALSDEKEAMHRSKPPLSAMAVQVGRAVANDPEQKFAYHVAGTLFTGGRNILTHIGDYERGRDVLPASILRSFGCSFSVWLIHHGASKTATQPLVSLPPFELQVFVVVV
jgi:hypothetical protein